MNEKQLHYLSAANQIEGNFKQLISALKNEGYDQDKLDCARADSLRAFANLKKTIKGEQL